MRVYVATENTGKIRELRTIFGDAGVKLLSFAEYCAPAEGSASYAENAALKARSLAQQLAEHGLTAAVLGDDSGLEVAALDGAPGVLSARYGGGNASWAERRRLVIAELAAMGTPDRSARFVCALHLITAAGHEIAVERSVEGRITETERGQNGFSYDPIFELAGTSKTFAEIQEVRKNMLSHRGLAGRTLMDRLRDHQR